MSAERGSVEGAQKCRLSKAQPWTPCFLLQCSARSQPSSSLGSVHTRITRRFQREWEAQNQYGASGAPSHGGFYWSSTTKGTLQWLNTVSQGEVGSSCVLAFAFMRVFGHAQVPVPCCTMLWGHSSAGEVEQRSDKGTAGEMGR